MTLGKAKKSATEYVTVRVKRATRKRIHIYRMQNKCKDMDAAVAKKFSDVPLNSPIYLG